MVRGERAVELDRSEEKDLEPYYRLIEMQKQMIDLIHQNAHAERECAVLRERLAREVEALARSRRSLPERLRESAAGWVKRLLRRNGHEPQDAREALVQGWSQPFAGRHGSESSPRAGLNS